MSDISDKGLLDLSVELSMRDVMAGNEFAIFVMIKNPFTKPIWIHKVHVSLPSEIMLASLESAKKEQTALKAQKDKDDAKNQKSKKKLDQNISSIQKKLDRLNTNVNKLQPNEIQSHLQILLSEMTTLREALPSSKIGTATVQISEQARIDKLTVTSDLVTVDIGNSHIGYVEILDSSVFLEQQAHARMVELESSLPENASLQPGNTAVYTILLKTRNPFLFRPSRYRLQFNISYGFVPKASQTDEQSPLGSEQVFINTIAHELSIRSSIFSVIAGAAIGGLLGGLARSLQISPVTNWQQEIPTNIVTIIVAILLSIVSIIFVARKSETQSFVSVEDFWGGVLIGFLVGYSGTTFFETLTGIKPSA